MDNEIFQIFEDFSESLLDILETSEKITGDFRRINQLLFSHLINNFTLFIENLNWMILILKPNKLEEYFYKSKTRDSNVKIKELIEIDDIWMNKWKENIAQKHYKWELSKKSQHEKIQQLLLCLWIDSNKYYVCLSWWWNAFWYQSWFIRPRENQHRKWRNPKWNRKRTRNHDTNSDDLLWFVDIFYLKRNAVTHNKWKYKDIEKINTDWKLKIKSDSVLVKKSSINSIIRFCCSFSALVIDDFIKDTDNQDKLKSLFERISKLEKSQIKLTWKQDKYFFRREKILNEKSGESISKWEYEKYFWISSSTASRDIQKYKEDKLFTIHQNWRWWCYTIAVS